MREGVCFMSEKSVKFHLPGLSFNYPLKILFVYLMK